MEYSHNHLLANSSYIESLYLQFKQNPELVDEKWRLFFEGYDFAKSNEANNVNTSDFSRLEFNVIDLINAYRERGHLFTKTNPVRTRRKYFPTLDIENFGFNQENLKQQFLAGNELGLGKASLEEIVNHLKQTYCQSIGVEYMYIRNPEIVEWLRFRMEQSKNTPVFSNELKLTIYEKLAHAVLFEQFIHKKFPGQKSFSLEGCEALIPALDQLIQKGKEQGVKDFVIGMAHRGRLNVLANILSKNKAQIFSEFAGKEYDTHYLLGDVKYHLGYSKIDESNINQSARIILVPNPSHLEAVDPVVVGLARARIDKLLNNDNKALIPIIIHGDAAIAGQGVVYELIQMSQLQGYKVGGCVHIVINNQLGFTTNYLDARSSVYCTDVAKTIQVPIFHVNADDIEAVVFVMQLALDFRQRFQRDVFIDLLGYRKYGHNESDEPRFTQPLLYKIIENHPSPLVIYKNHLLEHKIFQDTVLKQIDESFLTELEKDFQQSKTIEKNTIEPFLPDIWNKSIDKENVISINTNVTSDIIEHLGKLITQAPAGLAFYKKSLKLLEERRLMIEETKVLDWAMCELLAYASLLKDGYCVRISGQDVQRGTFSHRHAVITLEDSEETYIPLKQCEKNNAIFEIYNSLLSEYGVLGFEYGYALANPNGLNIWEAQFGDFANTAQVIFDQFISSAYEKWGVMNGLTVFLPHGYEGQGPEHSSARIERILSMCANENMTVTVIINPANLFHLLRKQTLSTIKKPLVVFTPKSLLRHPRCTANIEELSNGAFNPFIHKVFGNTDEIENVLLCAGKVYYDLIAYAEKENLKTFAFVQIEQLYPFPIEELTALKQSFSHKAHWIYVQEEPENMGAWYFVQRNLKHWGLKMVARPASGSPATGSSKFHIAQQQKIIEKAFRKCNCDNVCQECGMLCVSDLID